MSDSPRSQLLRAARTRALARLRAMYDTVFQKLMDEEIERLGGEPRNTVRDYKARGAWTTDDSD